MSLNKTRTNWKLINAQKWYFHCLLLALVSVSLAADIILFNHQMINLAAHIMLPWQRTIVIMDC